MHSHLNSTKLDYELFLKKIIQFFGWSDITNLVNHKRLFGVECQDYQSSVQFVLDEPDSAKYVWKMCVLQHTFYKLHAQATESSQVFLIIFFV